MAQRKSTQRRERMGLKLWSPRPLFSSVSSAFPTIAVPLRRARAAGLPMPRLSLLYALLQKLTARS